MLQKTDIFPSSSGTLFHYVLVPDTCRVQITVQLSHRHIMCGGCPHTVDHIVYKSVFSSVGLLTLIHKYVLMSYVRSAVH